MTATIKYDRPVRNLIDGLSATGHVTHQTNRKTMVTLHHNGGVNFTHQDILDIWKKRPASAHFDVDRAGAVCQYVKELEYAWACASGEGNRNSISIEMANSSGSPDWLVSETTWKSAARLAGWLFAFVIKARPTSRTLVYHHHWFATACAGPYMDRIYSRVLAETQAAYDAFVSGKTPTTQEDEVTPQDIQAIINGVLSAKVVDASKIPFGGTLTPDLKITLPEAASYAMRWSLEGRDQGKVIASVLEAQAEKGEALTADELKAAFKAALSETVELDIAVKPAVQ